MPVEYVPGLAGVPAARSRVCKIDGQAGLLSYRGYDVAQLAEHSTFEEVAFLLLKGQLPSKNELENFIGELRNHRRLKFRIIDLLKTLPEDGHPMGRWSPPCRPSACSIRTRSWTPRSSGGAPRSAS